MNLHLEEHYCPECGYVFANEDTEKCPMCGFDYNDFITCPYKEEDKTCSLTQKKCDIIGMAFEPCEVFQAVMWHNPLDLGGDKNDAL